MRYCVLNDLTLGYVLPQLPGSFQVLASRIGGHDPMNGSVAIGLPSERLRPATLADFASFRVSPVGHLPAEC